MERKSNIIPDPNYSNCSDLLWIIDTEGFIMRVNIEWEKTLHYKSSDLLGRRLLEFVHPDEIENTSRIINEAIIQPVQNCTNRFGHKDCSYHWFDWRSFPSNNLIYASAHDNTQYKKNETRWVNIKAKPELDWQMYARSLKSIKELSELKEN